MADFFCVVYDAVVRDSTSAIDNPLRRSPLAVILIIKKMSKYVPLKVFAGYLIKRKAVYLSERIKVKMKAFKISLVWCRLFYCARLL